MRFTMKQKMLCLGDDYIVKDQKGDEAYYVDGKVFAIRDTFNVNDMKGNRLARIQKKLLSIGSTYIVDIGGKSTIVHKNLLTFFRCSYSVDVPGPDDIKAQGNFFDFEYEFIDDGGTRVAEVSKRWLTLRDTYSIDILDDVDPVMIISAAVVIDQCCHEEKE